MDFVIVLGQGYHALELIHIVGNGFDAVIGLTGYFGKLFSRKPQTNNHFTMRYRASHILDGGA